MKNEMHPHRIKIGILIDCLHESYQSTIWSGIAKEAASQNVTLVSYVATSQDRTSHFHVHYKIVRDFIAASDVDGVILFTGSIAEHQGTAYAAEIASSFQDIPTLCMSSGVDGMPSIAVNNSRGIEELMDHLVGVHNYQYIAFLKGPIGHEEAEARYIAYREGLERNHLPFREELVVDGDFSFKSGRDAVSQLLEQKQTVDAIIAADDLAAFGVIAELKARRLHIPTDVAVAGFDDVSEAALSLPSLTTVRQPLSQMGQVAVQHMVAHLRDGQPLRRTRLPAKPVYRRSCGCFGEAVRNAKSRTEHRQPFAKQEIITFLYAAAEQHFYSHHSGFPGKKRIMGHLADLIESLLWDVEKASIREIFLNEVDMLLFRFEEYADNISLMNEVLTQLSGYLSSLFSDKGKVAAATSILQQAQALVREHRINSTQTNFLQETFFQLMIRETSQSIITTFEQRKLLEAISRSFPTLKINSLVFAVYKKDDDDVPLLADNWVFPEKSQLLLGYDNRRKLVNYPRGGNLFMTRQLFPDNMLHGDGGGNFVFMPLFFEDEHLGFTVFEYTTGIPLFMYEELRLHMSSALKSSFLMRDLRVQSMLDELTKLHNRRGFTIEGKKMFRVQQRKKLKLLMFFADMDDLKTINDTWGHEEGDMAIVGAASVLKQTFREEDLIARIGGDEFVAMLLWDQDKVVDLETLILKRFDAAIDTYNDVADKPYRLSISLGVSSTTPGDNKSIETLMREADGRLLANKRHRKSRAANCLDDVDNAH